jgi:hypothetical protein
VSCFQWVTTTDRLLTIPLGVLPTRPHFERPLRSETVENKTKRESRVVFTWSRKPRRGPGTAIAEQRFTDAGAHSKSAGAGPTPAAAAHCWDDGYVRPHPEIINIQRRLAVLRETDMAIASEPLPGSVGKHHRTGRSSPALPACTENDPNSEQSVHEQPIAGDYR